jgi:hypothetical protein
MEATRIAILLTVLSVVAAAVLRWTNFNMLAHYAHGVKSDKFEAQGAVLDRLVKSGVKPGVGNE